MIGFSKNLDLRNVNCNQDGDGSIQVVTFQLEEKSFVIANLYNNNIQSEQIETLKKLSEMIETSNPLEKEVIIGGDFKLLSIAEITKIANKFDLCDIYRIWNPPKKIIHIQKNQIIDY